MAGRPFSILVAVKSEGGPTKIELVPFSKAECKSGLGMHSSLMTARRPSEFNATLS